MSKSYGEKDNMFLPTPIMMVCAGNVCRSSFAEFYMRKKFEEKGIEGEVFSRGLLMMQGKKVPEKGMKVGLEFGVDMSSHMSNALLVPDMDRAALVLVMEPEQRTHLMQKRPEHVGKVMMLSQPCGGKVIDDPMGRSEETFRRVYGEIVACVDTWVSRF
jgi:protein-tyrosine phosphatase